MNRASLSSLKALKPIFFVLAFVFAACQSGGSEQPKNDGSGKDQGKGPKQKEQKVEIDSGSLGAYSPLPEVMASESNPITDAKVKLGRALYYETRISKGGEVSCNTCHLLNEYGVDHKKVSEGHHGIKGPRNAPSVYNAAGHVAQFWDGRSPDVEDQAKGPVLNPKEMGMPSEKRVERVLRSIPEYRKMFKKAFPKAKKAVTFDNMAKAIGAFERKLVTPAPWDAYLEGDKKALTAAQKKGFNKFMATGCQTCHTGPYLGGHMYQKLGLVKPWPNQEDKGRFEVTEKESDKMMFKVPSLRNVTETAPYFHDGSIDDLTKAVKMMAEHQLGKNLSDADANSIVAFLGALKGEIPKDYIAKPELPKAGPKTTKATVK